MEEALDLPEMPYNLKKHTSAAFLNEEERIEAAYRKQSEKDFLCFARGLTIDGQHGPRVFENCMALFQRECFEALAPSLHQLRDGEMPDRRRWWIERTKKAAKDSDLAVIVLWLIAFARRPFYAQIGAANKEQAAIVKQRIEHILHYNKWLEDYVEVVEWEVRSKKRIGDSRTRLAHMDIMSSDIAGAHGGTPDLLIVNELSHVVKWEFVENLLDNADGVAQGIVIIATNAGTLGTKCEVWKNNAVSSENWETYFWRQPAPWHSKETVADAKRRNSPSRYNRLWWGKWVSGKGDALEEDKIAACFTLKGPASKPEPGWVYVGGLDLSIRKDHAGLAILAVHEKQQRIRTAWLKAWVPDEETGEVDIIAIENAIRAAYQTYNLESLNYDPWEARFMAQRLRRKFSNVLEMSFSKPSNLTLMATTLIEAVNQGKLECYDIEVEASTQQGRLRRDFGKFNIVEKKPKGYKLEAVRDEFGHADLGTALVIALPRAVQLMGGLTGGLMPDEDLTDENEEDLTQEEVNEMPDELREIYGMSADEEERTLLKKAWNHSDPLL